MSVKFFKNNKLIVVLCNNYFIALIGLSIRSQTQSPPEQYVGTQCHLVREYSYPVNFVTGAIGNFFQSNKSNHNEVNQLKAKTKH